MFLWLKRFLGIGERKFPPGPPPLPPGAERIGREELLKAVPCLHPDVERVSDKRYGCLLEWDLSEEQLKAPKHSWFPKYFYKNKKRRHRLVLDDMGRRTVELIDGRNSIAQIAERLCSQTGHPAEVMQTAVLTFVTQLARRNAVSLARQ